MLIEMKNKANAATNVKPGPSNDTEVTSPEERPDDELENGEPRDAGHAVEGYVTALENQKFDVVELVVSGD